MIKTNNTITDTTITHTTGVGHGGFREGAGRKKSLPEGCKVRTFALTEEERLAVKEFVANMRSNKRAKTNKRPIALKEHTIQIVLDGICNADATKGKTKTNIKAPNMGATLMALTDIVESITTALVGRAGITDPVLGETSAEMLLQMIESATRRGIIKGRARAKKNSHY